jgi:MEDS: MEthanogen/methylotroph, DcmR Sensory domain/Putative zinc-finger
VECRGVEELLAAYALRALPDVEKSAVDRHLAVCSRHRDSIAELERATARLTLATKDRQPRPALRARIVDAIRAEAPPSVVTLGWNDESLPLGSHVCVFHSDEAALKQTMAFLRAGLDQSAAFGVIFADRSRFDPLVDWLQEGYQGSVRSLIDRGKLALIDGAPRSEELLQRIGQRLDQAMDEGFSVIRFLGFIGWDQAGWPDPASLVEFERRVNKVAKVYPAVIVCTYDVLRLAGPNLIDGGLGAHRITVLGDRIVRNNPFFVAA